MGSVSLETVLAQIYRRYKNKDSNGRQCRYETCKKFKNCGYKRGNGETCTIKNNNCLVGGCEKAVNSQKHECPFKDHTFRDLQCYLLDKEFVEFQTKELGVMQGVFLLLSESRNVKYLHKIKGEERLELFYSVPKKVNGEIQYIPDKDKKDKDKIFVEGRIKHKHLEFLTFFNDKQRLTESEQELDLIYNQSGELSFYLLWWAVNNKKMANEVFTALKLLHNSGGTERYHAMIKWLQNSGPEFTINHNGNAQNQLTVLWNRLENYALPEDKVRFFAEGAYRFLQTPDGTPISFLTIPLLGVPEKNIDDHHAFFKVSCVGFDALNIEEKDKRVGSIQAIAEAILSISLRGPMLSRFTLEDSPGPRRRVVHDFHKAFNDIIHEDIFGMLLAWRLWASQEFTVTDLITRLRALQIPDEFADWLRQQLANASGNDKNATRTALYNIFETFYFCQDIRLIIAKAYKRAGGNYNTLNLNKCMQQDLRWNTFLTEFHVQPTTNESVANNAKLLRASDSEMYCATKEEYRQFYVWPSDLEDAFTEILTNAKRYGKEEDDAVNISLEFLTRDNDAVQLSISNVCNKIGDSSVKEIMKKKCLAPLPRTLEEYGGSFNIIKLHEYDFKSNSFNKNILRYNFNLPVSKFQS